MRVDLSFVAQTNQSEHLLNSRIPLALVDSGQTERYVASDTEVRKERVVLKHHTNTSGLWRNHNAAGTDSLTF